MNDKKAYVNVATPGHAQYVTTVIRALKDQGFDVAVLDDPSEVATVIDSSILALQEIDLPEPEAPIITQRDFGKRGKKGKRNKDWHR